MRRHPTISGTTIRVKNRIWWKADALKEADSEIGWDGKIELVPRYSGVETVTFSGVGQCEAWHEGFKPRILDIPVLKDITLGTQKTVRWPGYAKNITVLKELGFLSMNPIYVDDLAVIPKHLVDAVLYPLVKLEDVDRDITCLRVSFIGEKDGKPCTHQAEMVVKYDGKTSFTSMARTTAMTGAIVVRMIAKGLLKPDGRTFIHPEKVIEGSLFDYLLTELEAAGIGITMTALA